MRKLNNNWEFNVFDIYDFNMKGKLDIYYNHIIENHKNIDGDILEAGVFRGKSLLSTALLLKELGSNKKVYGFDSFSGFPPIYHKNDNLQNFKELNKEGKISDHQLESHNKLKEYREILKRIDIDVSNISSSTNFSDTSEESIKRKMDYLGLDNIVLVKGDFESTMQNEKMKNLKLMSALLDCDLYSSYKVAMPFIWERMNAKGFLYLDEYYSLKFPGARIACDEFFNDKQEAPQKAESIKRQFERWYVVKNR